MGKLKTIQEVIEEKARKRAVDEVTTALREFRVLVETDVFRKTYIKLGEEAVSLYNAFWWKDQKLPKAVIAELTEKYIPEEVDKFVKDVERIKADVDNLYNQSQNI